MTDWYFYQDRGQTQGPVTLDEMRARVRDGRLRAFDLIYKEGESSWKMAMEHADLRESFREAGQSVMKGRPWVCLRRKSEDSFDVLTDGPFSDDEVRTALASGRLGYGDYVWRDGFADWQRVGAVETFNPRAGKDTKPDASAEPPPEALLAEVVNLKRGGLPPTPPPPPESDGRDLTEPSIEIETAKPNAMNPFVTRGPRRASQAASPPPPPKTRTRGTARVDIGAPPTDVALPPIPPKTETRRRAVAEPEPPPDVPATIPNPPKATPPAAPASAPFIPRTPRREEVRAAKWTDWSIVAALVVALGAGVGIFLVKRAKHARPATVAAIAPPPAMTTAPTETVEAPPASPEVAEAPASPEPAPFEPAPAPRAAESTELTLDVQASGGKARIDVRSNVAAQVPIYVQIIAAPGQVADAPAYYKYVRVNATGSRDRPVDLSAIDLPLGSYQIAAEVRDQRRQTTLNLGVGENKFRQAVGRQRKLGSAAIWQERLRLYATVGQLTQALQKSGPGKSFSSRGFANLDHVKKTTGAKYLFFEEWWELKQIVQEARRGVNVELLARAKRVQDRVLTASVWRARST